MIIESVFLSKDREKLNPAPTDPIFFKKAERYITDSFNKLLDEDEFISKTFNDLYLDGFEGVIFGGWVRDRIIELLTKKTLNQKILILFAKVKMNFPNISSKKNK